MAHRQVLDRVKETGDIFHAWSDEPWIVEGADVRVSIVGQDDGTETVRQLDGDSVSVIYPDLTGGTEDAVDITVAQRLAENRNASFMGDTKGGAFDIPGTLAREILSAPDNPNGRPNSDVIVPWVNGMDMTRRPRDMFISDFKGRSERHSSRYEVPFERLIENVRPQRLSSRTTKAEWWQHERPRPEMRIKLRNITRFIVTPRVAKHRLFAWFSLPTIPDSATIAIARDDDCTFGVLHSRAHELWSLRLGTSLEDRPRYTPTTTFETYPFPWPLNRPEAELSTAQEVHR